MMQVYTDNPEFAEHLIGEQANWRPVDQVVAREVDAAAQRLLDETAGVTAEVFVTDWPWLVAVERAKESQYDALIDMSRAGTVLPDRLLCVADTGERFHGFRGRPWSAASGNIHLSVHVAPPASYDGDLTIGLLALGAVSAIETIDSVPGLARRAGIKWVNDILVDGAKVGGILAHTEATGEHVTAGVIGIGLNVESTPQVQATPFVPRVISLRDLSTPPPDCNQATVFRTLIAMLSRNYAQLIEGRHDELLDRYRERSLVIGREVAVCREDSESVPTVVARGRVTGLGKKLELLLNTSKKPVDRGRIILDPMM